MKKALLSFFIIGLIASNLIFVHRAEARHHTRPWCYLLFQTCESDDDDPAPAPAPAPVNHAPIWTSSQTAFNIKTGQLLQLTVGAFDSDGDLLIYNVAFLPIGASFDQATKTFSWTPSDSQEGTYLVQFSVYDGKAYAYQSITINVAKSAPTNHKPIWSSLGNQNVFVGQTLEFMVSASDPDNDFISYSGLNLPSGSYFDSSSRIFSWVPNQNQIGTHVVTFRAFDGENTADVGVIIYVSAPNNKPYFTNANPPSKARAGKLYFYDLNAADTDNDPLTYSLPTAPLGMTINPVTGFIQWTPIELQSGFNYAVAAVSDGKTQTTVGFYIFVEGETAAVPAAQQPPVHPKPITSEKLKISNLKIENADGEIVVSWNTNLPARARVIYDTVSEADKVKDFTYANATPEINTFSTNHQVNLGKLSTDTIYYLRAVSKTSDQMAISSEVVFIQLENGQLNSLLGASLFHHLANLLNNKIFLWLVIAILSIFVVVLYRKHQKTNSPL